MDYWTQMMWRPVLANPQIASYTEVRFQWTLEDLLDACELLDYKADLEEEARPKDK